MISKEEYKKTLIRMWDSVRKMDKGTDSCSCVCCDECPVNSVCGNHTVVNLSNHTVNLMNAYEIIEFIEKWAKEHPIETNGSRFLKDNPNAEVYKYEYDRTYDNEEDGYKHGFVYVKLDDFKPFVDDENGTKFPIRWWESEVDDASCN